MIPLGSGGEFDRIRAIVAALGATAGPIGDDTAPIPESSGQLVTSVDTTVEGVHFLREWITPEEIGWRATASALSDLAAAAARPVGVVVALTVPADADTGASVDLMRGVGAASAAVGAQVLGGDMSSGAAWSVAVTVFGRVRDHLSRAGAHVGDGVWVTGALGGARAAVVSWQRGRTPAAAARARFAHPLPRIAAGAWLAAHGATAMIDVSDGVVGDAEHLAAASGVAIELQLERLPLDPAVTDVAHIVGEAPASFAAVGGEDYELLVTLPPAFAAAEQLRDELQLSLARIGTVRRGVGVQALLHGVPQAITGYRHAL